MIQPTQVEALAQRKARTFYENLGRTSRATVDFLAARAGIHPMQLPRFCEKQSIQHFSKWARTSNYDLKGYYASKAKFSVMGQLLRLAIKRSLQARHPKEQAQAQVQVERQLIQTQPETVSRPKAEKKGQSGHYKVRIAKLGAGQTGTENGLGLEKRQVEMPEPKIERYRDAPQAYRNLLERHCFQSEAERAAAYHFIRRIISRGAIGAGGVHFNLNALLRMTQEAIRSEELHLDENQVHGVLKRLMHGNGSPLFLPIGSKASKGDLAITGSPKHELVNMHPLWVAREGSRR